jgi:DNA mismatch repair ATPase MutS
MNNFITDRQTTEDLNLLGRFKKDSVINIFDRTRTRAGRQALEDMFRKPMTNAQEINERSRIFSYYKSLNREFPFDETQVELIEYYINSNTSTDAMSSAMNIFTSKCKMVLANNRAYEKMLEGMGMLAKVLLGAVEMVEAFPRENCPDINEIEVLTSAITSDHRSKLQTIAKKNVDMTLGQAISADKLMRLTLGDAVRTMMQLLAKLDLNMAVGSTAADKGFGFAEAVNAQERFIEMEGVYHPSLVKPVANDIRIDAEKNVFFLTGVNMAGKSTFMKAVSIALYLAQMGFPVPASKIRFTPVDGIFTSINVPDDIAQGYSHFYAEVLRVKSIAQRVAEGRNLFVIFDELFKGTNVKDAYDATLAVTDAYASHRNCLYIISTHIVEVGPALSEKCGNVQFRFLPTQMDGTRLVYPYKLAEGISADRHGMTIIKNEKILDIIRGEVINESEI